MLGSGGGEMGDRGPLSMVLYSPTFPLPPFFGPRLRLRGIWGGPGWVSFGGVGVPDVRGVFVTLLTRYLR